MSNNFDVAIIGSGMAGLTAGITLQKKGKSTVIIEKSHIVGGLLQSFKYKGMIFDTGVHYLGSLDEGQILWKLFKYLNVLDKIELSKLDEDGFETYRFPSEEIKIPNGYDRLTNSLIKQCPDDSPDTIKGILNEIEDLCKKFPLYNLDPFLNFANNKISEISVLDYFKSRGASERLCTILLANNNLYGVNPNSCPFPIYALIFDSYIKSAYRINNGSQHLADALINQYLEHGGKIIKSNGVKNINIDGRTCSKLTLADKTIITAKQYISTIHPKETVKRFKGDHLPTNYIERVLDLKETLSSVTLLMGVNDKIKPINSMVHKYRNMDITEQYTTDLQNDMPSFIFYSIDESNKPGENCLQACSVLNYSALEQFANTTTKKRGAKYEQLKHSWEEKMIDFISEDIPNLRENILFKTSATPLTLRDYTSTWNGSTYGIERSLEQQGPKGVYHRTRIKNLYLAGQNALIPGVLGSAISAIIVCAEFFGMKEIIEDINKTIK